MLCSMSRKDDLNYIDILAEQLKDPVGAGHVSVYVVAAFAEKLQPYIKELLDAEQ